MMTAQVLGLLVAIVVILLAQSTSQYERAVNVQNDSPVFVTTSARFQSKFSVEVFGPPQTCLVDLFAAHGKLYLNDSIRSVTDDQNRIGSVVIDGPLNCTWVVSFTSGEEDEIQFRATSDLNELDNDFVVNNSSLPFRFYKVDTLGQNSSYHRFQRLANVSLTTKLREARANSRGVKFAVHISVPRSTTVFGNSFFITFQRRGECFAPQVACAPVDRECYSAEDQCDTVWDCPISGRDELNCGCVSDDAFESDQPSARSTSISDPLAYSTSRKPEAELFRCSQDGALSVPACYTTAQRCDGIANCARGEFDEKMNNRKLESQFFIGYYQNDQSYDDAVERTQMSADEFNCDLQFTAYRYRNELSKARSESPDKSVQGYGASFPYGFGYSGMSTSLVVTLVVTVNMTALFAVLACAFMQRCRANLSRAAVNRYNNSDRLRSPFGSDRLEYPFSAEYAFEPDSGTGLPADSVTVPGRASLAAVAAAARGRGTSRRGGVGRNACLSDRVRSYRQRGRLGRYSAYLPFAGVLRRAPPPSYDETLQFEEALLTDALFADGHSQCAAGRGQTRIANRCSHSDGCDHSELVQLGENGGEAAGQSGQPESRLVAVDFTLRDREEPMSLSDVASCSQLAASCEAAQLEARAKRRRAIRRVEEADDERLDDSALDADADIDDADDVALLELPSNASTASCSQSVNDFVAPISSARSATTVQLACASLDCTGTTHIELADRARSDFTDN